MHPDGHIVDQNPFSDDAALDKFGMHNAEYFNSSIATISISIYEVWTRAVDCFNYKTQCNSVTSARILKVALDGQVLDVKLPNLQRAKHAVPEIGNLRMAVASRFARPDLLRRAVVD